MRMVAMKSFTVLQDVISKEKQIIGIIMSKIRRRILSHRKKIKIILVKYKRILKRYENLKCDYSMFFSQVNFLVIYWDV